MLRTEVVNRLQEIVAVNEDGLDVLLFDRLCRIAREGAAKATKWTRGSLLAQLRGAVRLKVIPYLGDDINRLNAYSLEALNVVSEKVDDFHVEREGLQQKVASQLDRHRVVSIGGLPGCGKSAVLKRFAQKASATGPILFLKNDRITGSGWSTFVASLGLSNTDAVQLLLEIGSAGTPILFIDGIDRIRPDQQGVVLDLVNADTRRARPQPLEGVGQFARSGPRSVSCVVSSSHVCEYRDWRCYSSRRSRTRKRSNLLSQNRTFANSFSATLPFRTSPAAHSLQLSLPTRSRKGPSLKPKWI